MKTETTESNRNAFALADKKALQDAAKLVRTLNGHHMRTSAGFYHSISGRRCFRARIRDLVFQIYDFEFWFDVHPSEMQFHDHNGRDIA